jgi:hypothetical protein
MVMREELEVLQSQVRQQQDNDRTKRGENQLKVFMVGWVVAIIMALFFDSMTLGWVLTIVAIATSFIVK